MGSTGGGFLIGVGVIIFLLSSAGMYAVQTVYVSTYSEVLTYKNSILELYDLTHSPQLEGMVKTYRELSEVVPQLDTAVENYAKAYPIIMQHKGDVEWFYSTTHSKEYGDVVAAVWQLSSYTNQIVGALEFFGLGWLADPLKLIPTAASYLDQAKDWSEMARNAVNVLEMFPPERMRGYVEQLKTVLSLLPPEKLESYLSQGRAASERAVETIRILEKYPPQIVFTYTAVGVVIGFALLIPGVALALRARNGHAKAIQTV